MRYKPLATEATMKLWSDSFAHGGRIDVKNAFGKHHPERHVELSKNLNPHLAWSDVPKGARSLVLICHDPDVPSRGDDVNKEGRTVPADLPRVDFFHWVLVDIAPSTSSIAEGELASGITPRGKPGPQAPNNMRQGVNNYTDWFAGDADMKGTYFGYDGPCPPWNDEIVHHYHFTLYATDLDRVAVEGAFRAADVKKQIEGHVLDKASIMGTYAINPRAVDKG
jgi:Raf kinase inhibitor-like YbhB/YbcL family protein